MAMGALILNPDNNKILLIKRSLKKDYAGGIWEYPMGRINQFEEPEDGLRREIYEEVAIKVDLIKPLSVFHIFRGEKIAENELIGVIYYARAKSIDVKLSEEHTEFKWVEPIEALELLPNDSMKKDIKALIREIGILTY